MTVPASPAPVLLVGAAGRMGRAMARLLAEGEFPALRLAAAIDRPDCPALGTDISTLLMGQGNLFNREDIIAG